jgi:hypothetical protein
MLEDVGVHTTNTIFLVITLFSDELVIVTLVLMSQNTNPHQRQQWNRMANNITEQHLLRREKLEKTLLRIALKPLELINSRPRMLDRKGNSGS